MNKQWWRLAAVTVVAAAGLAACGGSSDDEERTPATLALAKIGGFAHTGGASSAEITAYDPLSKRLFVVNGALGSVDVLNLSNPGQPALVGTVAPTAFGAGMGGVNGVAVHNGVVALAVEANPKTNNGKLFFLRADTLAIIGSVNVGALPDMVTFTPDGRYVLVANEGEPNSYGQAGSVDPEGSISIVEVGGLSPTATSISASVSTAGFASFNNQQAALRAAGVRLFGPGATVAQDLEPEYIAVSADSATAYVTLQENNAVAVVNIATRTVTAIRPLGLKDHSVAGMGLDASNEDGGTNTNTGTPAISIRTLPVKGMYMPDAIATYQVGTQTFLVTANEGDAREYAGINAAGREDPRVREHCAAGLDPAVFGANAADLVRDSNLGRLRVTSFPNGDRTGKNAAGQCTELVAFGGRSFSIWTSDGTRVFDSGDQFEQRTATALPALFNVSNDNADLDDRSPAKGPEPEGVVLARFGSKTYAFIGLERIGGVMVYDVSAPTAPVYVTYLNTRTGATGDRGPEGLTFVKASDSPNGKPLLIVGNETSGTTAVFEIQLGY